MRLPILCLALLLSAALVSTAVQGQTPERAVIAGSLTEDKDGDGMLSGADGGAVTLVELMQRSPDGGYACVDQILTGDDGKFRFEDLSFADYELTIWWGPGFWETSADGAILRLTGTAADLRDGLEAYSVRLKQDSGLVATYPVSTASPFAATSCRGLNNPLKPQNVCQKTGPLTYVGPQEVSFGEDSLAFTLPVGTYRVWFTPPPVAFGIVVCYVEGNSSITFAVPGAAESAREVNDPAASGVLDSIARSVRLVSVSEPPPAPTPTAMGQGEASGPIKPPDTGDAGLR